MWGKIIIPMYRLWLHGLYGLYGPWCPLPPKRPINLISLSLFSHWGGVTHIYASLNLLSLVQIMVCPLIGAKPLSAPMSKWCFESFEHLMKNNHLRAGFQLFDSDSKLSKPEVVFYSASGPHKSLHDTCMSLCRRHDFGSMTSVLHQVIMYLAVLVDHSSTIYLFRYISCRN